MSSGFESHGASPGGALEFRLLGPLEVRRDGTLVDLGPPKQRAVLALLLLHKNRVVPTARLIDELWGDSPPETARSALQGYVAGIRKALGDGQATLSTRAPGYLLDVAPQSLDLDRFEQLCAAARANDDPAVRSASLRDALALWRDAPLAEFDGEPFAAVAAEHLEERRLAALEERIDADLALGRHVSVITELDTLILEHPYRERFRAQLMLALYRAGRQADALAAYREARAAFASGLGLEPGPELRSLERAVLAQDPALDAPRFDPGESGSSPPSRVGRRTLGVALVVVAAIVAAAVGLIVLTLGDEPGMAVPSNSVAVIDPATNEVADVVQVGLRPQSIAAGGGAVWVGNRDDRNLTRIDVRTRRPAGTVPLDERTPTGLAFDRGTVWVGHGLLGSVSLVDAQFGKVARVVPVTTKGAYSATGSVVAGAGAVWAVFGDGTLARLDRETGEVVGRTRTDASPAGVTVGYGSVWVVSTLQATVQRFSPLSLAEVDSVTVLTRPSAIAAGFGDIWVASAGANLVYRVEIGGGSIAAPIPVGDGPSAIAIGVDAVWVANTAAGSVDRIDPETNRVVETIEVGEAPAGIVVAGNLVWVTVQAR